MKHKKNRVSMAFLLVALLLTACQETVVSESASERLSEAVEEAETAAASASDEEQQQEQAPDTVEAVSAVEEIVPEESVWRTTVRLRTELSDEYRDITISVGEKVDVPSRLGYTFLGYNSEPGGEGITYIDETGTVVLDYFGEDLLELYPRFAANEYEISICVDGEPLDGFNKIQCEYDKDFVKDLPLGRLFTSADEQECIVVGFESIGGESLITPETEEMSLQEMEASGEGEWIDHDKRQLQVNVVTSDASYQYSNYNTRTITNDGFLEQTMGDGGEAYDRMEMPETLDLDALLACGYGAADVTVTYVISSENKKSAQIRIRTVDEEIPKEKTIRKDSVIAVDVSEDDFPDGSQTGEKTFADVPLEQLDEIMLIYYDSDGLFAKDWTLDTILVEIRFKK